MIQYIWPILVVVGSNTIYHICAKSVPEKLSPFVSLAVTYTLAAVLSVIMFFVTDKQKSFFTEVMKVNWAPVLLGFAIVGLEFGFIAVYRVGWKVSIASLVASIALEVVLLLVGVLFYKEVLSARQIVGAIVCTAGLVLISI